MLFDAASWNWAQHFLLDLLVILFLVSGTAKLFAWHTFRFGLQLLPFMTTPVATVVAIALPIAELALAACLYMNFSWAKYAAIGLLLVFSGIAALAVGMRRHVPCGCFGQLDGETLSWRTVLRNGILILIVVGVLGFERRTEWLLPTWLTGVFMLCALSLLRVYNNHRLILDLRKAKLL
jgi:Methylamine utilisation protein MauE